MALTGCQKYGSAVDLLQVESEETGDVLYLAHQGPRRC